LLQEENERGQAGVLVHPRPDQNRQNMKWFRFLVVLPNQAVDASEVGAEIVVDLY
jgi:hypothetical protein